MKYIDDSELNNEDLVACYPRRIEMQKNYELWQFPYVKEEVLHDENDIVGINFFENRIRISIISECQNHLEDSDYINRIISLVHDISTEFIVEKHLVSNLDSSSTEKILESIRKK